MQSSHAAQSSLSFTLLQLADSAFPTGGFAHSNGFESARAHGFLRDTEAAEAFVRDSIVQAAHAFLPFVQALHEAPERAKILDATCDAFLSNPTANHASRVQGRSLRHAAEHVFCIELDPALVHHAPMFGAVTHAVGVHVEDARRLALFMHARGILSAAVRLNVFGPLEAQALERDLGPHMDDLLEKTANLTIDDLALTSPMSEIYAARHDTLDSRLFLS